MAETVKPSQRLTPLAVAVTIAVQTGGGLMWLGQADARLGEVERQVQAGAASPVQLARMEEQVAAMRAQLARIEDKVDGLKPPRDRDG